MLTLTYKKNNKFVSKSETMTAIIDILEKLIMDGTVSRKNVEIALSIYCTMLLNAKDAILEFAKLADTLEKLSEISL